MMDAYMDRAAAHAYYGGMFATALAACISFLVFHASGPKALVIGMIGGWSTAVVVHGLSLFYYMRREERGAKDD